MASLWRFCSQIAETPLVALEALESGRCIASRLLQLQVQVHSVALSRRRVLLQLPGRVQLRTVSKGELQSSASESLELELKLRGLRGHDSEKKRSRQLASPCCAIAAVLVQLQDLWLVVKDSSKFVKQSNQSYQTISNMQTLHCRESGGPG